MNENTNVETKKEFNRMDVSELNKYADEIRFLSSKKSHHTKKWSYDIINLKGAE